MNTSVYRGYSTPAKKRMGVLSRLTASYCLLLLLSSLLTGCAQEPDTDKDIDNLTSKAIPAHIRKQKQPTIGDIFSDPESAEVSETGAQHKSLKQKISEKAEDALDNAETNPAGLDRAISLLNKLLTKLPTISYDECQKEIISPKFNVFGPCNQWAVIHSTIAKLYYYKGELYEPETNFAKRREFYNAAKDESAEALRYNPFYAGAYLWNGSSLGASLSMSVSGKHPLMSASQKFKNRDALKKTPQRVVNALSYALSLSPNFENGAIYLALGRSYHKLPAEYLQVGEQKYSLAEKYLYQAFKKRPNHFMTNLYLFEYYSDDKDGAVNIDNAKKFAWRLKVILHDKNFRSQHPIFAKRITAKVSAFENQYGKATAPTTARKKAPPKKIEDESSEDESGEDESGEDKSGENESDEDLSNVN